MIDTTKMTALAEANLKSSEKLAKEMEAIYREIVDLQNRAKKLRASARRQKIAASEHANHVFTSLRTAAGWAAAGASQFRDPY